jgi:hypothetical protein
MPNVLSYKLKNTADEKKQPSGNGIRQCFTGFK